MPPKFKFGLLIKPGINARLSESVRTALKLTGGAVLVAVVDGEEKALLRTHGLRHLRY